MPRNVPETEPKFIIIIFIIIIIIIIITVIIIINKYLDRANSSVVILYTKLYTIYKLLSWRPYKTLLYNLRNIYRYLEVFKILPNI